MQESVDLQFRPAKASLSKKCPPFIIGNEAAERFSFYGMRSILVTFLVAQFFNPTRVIKP